MDIAASPYNNLAWVRQLLCETLGSSVPEDQLSDDLLRGTVISCMTQLGDRLDDAKKKEAFFQRGIFRLINKIYGPAFSGTSASSLQDDAVKTAVHIQAAKYLEPYTHYAWFNTWLSNSVAAYVAPGTSNLFGLHCELKSYLRFQPYVALLKSDMIESIYAQWSEQRSNIVSLNNESIDAVQPWLRLLLTANAWHSCIQPDDILYFTHSVRRILKTDHRLNTFGGELLCGYHDLCSWGIGDSMEDRLLGSMFLPASDMHRQSYLTLPVDHRLKAASLFGFSVANVEWLHSRGVERTWSDLQPFLPALRESLLGRHLIEALAHTTHPWSLFAKDLDPQKYAWMSIRRSMLDAHNDSPFFSSDIFGCYLDWIENVQYAVAGDKVQMRVGELCTDHVFDHHRTQMLDLLQHVDMLYQHEHTQIIPLDCDQSSDMPLTWS